MVADNPALLSAILLFAGFINSFLPIVPIEIGSIFAGYLASAGHGSMLLMIISVGAGMSLGQGGIYYLSLRYGETIIEKKPLSNIFSKKHYDRMKVWFGKYGVWSLFYAKLVPGMSLVSVLCCGSFKLGRINAIAGISGSNFAFFACLIILGKLAGDNWRAAYSVFHKVGFVALALTLAAILFIFFYNKYKTRNGTG